MKSYLQKFKTKKLLLILLITMINSFILGCLYVAILSKENQALVKESLDNFFTTVQSNKINYSKSLFRSLTNNMMINFFVWILGISIIGIPIIFITFIFKVFVCGFTFTSIIYHYGLKGVLLASIYILPHVFNLLLLFILTYYSLQFAIMLCQYLFRKKEGNKQKVMKRYIKILTLTTLLFIVSSSIEVYLIPFILSLF